MGAQNSQPKPLFAVFAPTAEFCPVMRIDPVSRGPQNPFGVQGDGNGLGRFATVPGRPHFLIPAERRQTFPLGEFT